MNKIITIGREFGSGGREVGRRIAELLGIAYYDREIIAEIAKRTSLSENYVRNVAEHKPVIPFPIHTGRTFWAVIPDYGQSVQQEQHNIIREMASHSDCVIVGRGADYILREFNPLRLFIYSDMSSKIKRCQDNSTSDYDRGAGMTEDELEKRIDQINKSRADYYEFYTGQKWGDKANYDLCINTGRYDDIKSLAEVIAKLC